MLCLDWFCFVLRLFIRVGHIWCGIRLFIGSTVLRSQADHHRMMPSTLGGILAIPRIQSCTTCYCLQHLLVSKYKQLPHDLPFLGSIVCFGRNAAGGLPLTMRKRAEDYICRVDLQICIDWYNDYVCQLTVPKRTWDWHRLLIFPIRIWESRFLVDCC